MRGTKRRIVSAEAVSQYVLQYPARRHSSEDVIQCLEQRLRESGILM